MLMVELEESAPDNAENVVAAKVPADRFMLAMALALFAGLVFDPPMRRIPTVAEPPVWAKVPVTPDAALASERQICRVEVAGMLRMPVPLRLKVAVQPVLVPTVTPSEPAIVVSVPPLRL